MTVQAITDENFEQETANGVTLTDLWATWCGPCRMQSPVIEAAAKKNAAVKFTKLDVDENQQTAEKLGVRAIPTLIIKKDGQVVERLTGFHTLDMIEKVLDKYTA
ncbi:thioredoxin [Weissella diestrammenae]|uniref:Thioredoxin n=1 Tax=Weissella diestrammenae TaxID=1162633 RepID=A0A7G9T7D4_9LACO|nr:thioredoxin [Weissella diestrammenae]MCM0582022.1 thioredoxin [Weissella diestrammenae]QNN76009.1 thioredoxin [Weissella diestrammenae]